MAIGQGFVLKRVRFQGARAGGTDLVIQGTGFGGSLIECFAAGNSVLANIAGGGRAIITQAGVIGAVSSAVSCVPIRALNYPFAEIPGNFLAATDTIPPPDSSAGLGTGVSTLQTLATLTQGLDWTGGFGAAPDGTVMIAHNNSTASGNAINIVGDVIGGTVKIPYPYMLWGFSETVAFMKMRGSDVFMWKGGSAYFHGGSDGGGRIVPTSDATPTILYRWPLALANGVNGGVAVCDVQANKTSDGSLVGLWTGVALGWDSSFAQVVGTGGAPGVQWQSVPTAASLSGSVSTDGNHFGQLFGTGLAGTPIRWRVSNWRWAGGSN